MIAWRFRLQFFYRKNVVAMINNHKKQVLVVSPWWSKRKQWQFPQGGVDKGESSEEAIKREMLEELGTDKFKITQHKQNANRYEWPWSYRLIRGYKGQKQDLYIMKFTGTDKDIDIEKQGELSAWKWVDRERLLYELATPRRNIGRTALDFTKRKKSSN